VQRAAPGKADQSAALACFAFATIDSMFSPNPCATLLPLCFLAQPLLFFFGG
jgi:hypothetical protein